MNPDLSNLAKEYGIELLVLFGSRATGRARPESDADLAIRLTQPIKLEKELMLRRDLTNILGHLVDLVFLDKASPLLLKKISQTGKILYGDVTDFNHFRVEAIKRFIDFKPYFELRRTLLHHKLT